MDEYRVRGLTVHTGIQAAVIHCALGTVQKVYEKILFFKEIYLTKIKDSV